MKVRERLLRNGMDLARSLGAKLVVIISNEDIQHESEDIPIIVAPKKYAFMIESSIDYILGEGRIDEILGNEIVSKTIQLPLTSEYMSLLSYLEGVKDGRIVGVVLLDALKSILLIDFEKSRIYRVIEECGERVPEDVLKAVFHLALSISNKGREGRRIGTAFVVGDVEEVMRRSYQLIINPFEGQPEDVRDVKNPENWESIRELAQLDGVFIVGADGIIRAGGRYLSVSGKEVRVKKGLGSRHVACAAITRETQAIAITVSESGGTIRIYKDGEELIEIEPWLL